MANQITYWFTIKKPNRAPKIIPDQGCAEIPQELPAHCPKYPIKYPANAPKEIARMFFNDVILSNLVYEDSY